MERQFSLTLHYGPKNSNYLESRDKSETITASSVVELISKFTLTIAKLDREFYEEDLHEVRMRGHKDDDIPF